MVSDAITGFFSNLAGNILGGLLGICSGLIDNVSHHIGEVDKWFNRFLGFSVALMTVVVIVRCIMTISDTAEGCEVSLSNILIGAIKGAISIPFLVFIQKVVQEQVIFPLLKYSFGLDKKFRVKAINNINKTMPGAIQLSAMLLLLLIIFYAVVLCFFFVKMCKYYVDMMWFNLTIPFVAVSMATETFNYGSTWWKKFIYYNLTILFQVISLSLMIGSFLQVNKGMSYLMGSIGFGFTTLGAPFVIDQLWASTGTTRGALRGMARAGSRMVSGMFR